MRILVIEDDAKVSASLHKGLEEAGYAVDTTPTVAGARKKLGATQYDLVVLDLGLPDGDGLDVLRKVRDDDTYTPVLILTARDTLSDRVQGLDRGADDYLAKPFAFSEFLARIRALLRRAGGGESLVLEVGDLRIDVVAREATRNGRFLDLRPREFDLLEYLARSAGQTVSRDALVRDVWKQDSRAAPMDNVIDVHISHLRDKLDKDYATRLLHTVRGVGFVLRAPS